MKDKINEKEVAKLKQIIRIRKKKKQTKNKTATTTTTKQENYMIKNPLVTLLYMEKHAVYFEFLKRFIDIPFVKSVRRHKFLVYISSTALPSLTLLMCWHCLLK